MLDQVNFRVDAGEILAVVGPSGAGKSTLAQCINLLTPPTSGSVVVNGEDLATLSSRKLRVARRRIGTVFQSAGLFERRTAAENVALPLEYLGVTAGETTKRVAGLLDRVGLSERARHYPFQLSGGQCQRVGLARALALRPSVLLSDEAAAGGRVDGHRQGHRHQPRAPEVHAARFRRSVALTARPRCRGGLHRVLRGRESPLSQQIFAPPAPDEFAGQLTVGSKWADTENIQNLVATFKDPAVRQFLATDPTLKGILLPLQS